MAAFVDTNIFIYAFVKSNPVPAHKVTTANALVTHLINQRELILSAQVLSEFTANALRKGNPPLSLLEAAAVVRRLSRHTVIAIDATLVQLALTRVQLSRISYWDALILEAALRSGANILYTEDMHHGTRYGSLEVRNPFL
jgi:predicted nucleic acid-binding protein